MQFFQMAEDEHMKRVAFNGFGRIGRQVFKLLIDDPGMEIVAINNTSGGAIARHLLKYDSTYGTYNRNVSVDGDFLVVGDKRVRILTERDPSKLPWRQSGVDVVIENTGVFTKREECQKHIDAGAKKVLLTAPGKNMDLTVVKGVNEHWYDPKKHHIISNASCTTNCLAPMVKVLQDNFGIEKGFMVTIHAMTNDQSILDQSHKDFRRARTAITSIIPTTTGAAIAVAEVIPELKGKLDGLAYRVPVVTGSIVEFTAELRQDVDVEKIKWLFKSVAEHELSGIIQYTEEPIVSVDIIGNSHSCIFDAPLAKAMGKLVKLAGWYDNEWGYSCRVADIAHML